MKIKHALTASLLTGVVGAFAIAAPFSQTSDKQAGANTEQTAHVAAVRQDSAEQVKAILDITDGVLVDLDIQHRGNEGFTFAVPLGLEVFTIEIAPFSNRSPDYKVFVQEQDGSLREIPAGPVNTYRGIAAEFPGSTVAANMEDGLLTTQVRLNDNELWYIEPASTRLPNLPATSYIIYRADDIISPEGFCATPDIVLNPEENAFEGSSRGTGDCGGLCVAEIGIDADFEYYQDRGSSTVNVENRVNSVINSVNNLYESQVGIRHTISGIIVRSNSNDPYSTSSIDTRLDQLRQTWRNNGTGIPHDVAQLFSGTNFSGSTIGLAFTPGVCTASLRYSVVESDCCGSFGCATDLTAHELGHNWSSSHVNSFLTMHPNIQCANNFTQNARNQITGYRNNLSCLDPAAAPAPFSLLTPANGATEVETGPLLSWQPSEGATSYTILIDTNGFFTNPINGGVSTTFTSTNLPAGLLEEGTNYFWRIIANNSAGTRIGTPNTSVFSTVTPVMKGCPGDVDGNNTVDLADLNAVLAAFGQNGGGDADGDNDTDLADLNLVLANFGNAC